MGNDEQAALGRSALRSEIVCCKAALDRVALQERRTHGRQSGRGVRDLSCYRLDIGKINEADSSCAWCATPRSGFATSLASRASRDAADRRVVQAEVCADVAQRVGTRGVGAADGVLAVRGFRFDLA